MLVLDYSFGRPSLQSIKDAGFVGIMRYLSYDTGKNLSLSELNAARSLGLQVGVVWETTATRVKGGANAGKSDASEALRQYNALGLSCPIYFAIDYDAPESDQSIINDYFRTCSTVVGKERLGCYAGYWPLKRLFDAGIITYGWQTLAWSGGNHEKRAHLYQNGAQTFGADVNDVLKDNWNGQLGGPPMPADPDVVVKQSQIDAWLHGDDGIDHWKIEAYNRGVQADNLTTQNSSLVSQIKSQQSKIDDLNGSVSILNDRITILEQQLEEATSKPPITTPPPTNTDKSSLADYSVGDLLQAAFNKLFHIK